MDKILLRFSNPVLKHCTAQNALLRVFNYIFFATDSGHCVVLVLLDLTAAFDTVDHEILIARLEQWVGIIGTALEWFRSYLSHRTFCVSLGDCPPLLPSHMGYHRALCLALFYFPSIFSTLVRFSGKTAFLFIAMRMTPRFMSLLKSQTPTELSHC